LSPHPIRMEASSIDCVGAIPQCTGTVWTTALDTCTAGWCSRGCLVRVLVSRHRGWACVDARTGPSATRLRTRDGQRDVRRWPALLLEPGSEMALIRRPTITSSSAADSGSCRTTRRMSGRTRSSSTAGSTSIPRPLFFTMSGALSHVDFLERGSTQMDADRKRRSTARISGAAESGSLDG